MSFSPDIIAYAGNRVVRNFLGNTVAALINNIAQALLDVGWTQTDTGTSNGQPFFKMLSKQSPWVASGSPPIGYIGKVKVYIHATDATACKVQLSNAADTITQIGDFILGKDATNLYRIIACPYQFVIYTPRFFDFSRQLLVSTLHTPPNIQSGFGTVDCFGGWDCAGFRIELFNSNSYVVNIDNNGTNVWEGNAATAARPQFVLPFSGAGATAGAGLDNTAVKFANMIDDPTMADPTKWYPMICPPMLAWGQSTSLGPIRIRGWLWDCIIVNAVYADNNTLITPDGHTFTSFTQHTQGIPGTLFFCTAGTG